MNRSLLAALLPLAAMAGAPPASDDNEPGRGTLVGPDDLPIRGAVFLPERTGGHRGLGGPVHSPGTKAHRAWKVRRQTSGRGGKRT